LRRSIEQPILPPIPRNFNRQPLTVNCAVYFLCVLGDTFARFAVKSFKAFDRKGRKEISAKFDEEQ